MSKIHHLYPNWLSKSALAHKLGVSERTIYARWKRGELIRQEIDGEGSRGRTFLLKYS